MTIVEGHATLAEALHATLEQAGFDPLLADPTASATALTGLVVRSRPDVVILGADIEVVGDGTRLVSPLARAGLQIIVLAGHVDDPVRWGICLSEGARTVVKRTISLSDFLGLVRAVAEGSFVPSADQKALQRAAEAREHVEQRRLLRHVARLTTREREILVDLTRGQTAAQIAVAGFVSEETVRTQIRAILHKLEVTSQLAAVAIAHRTGIQAETPR